MSLPLPLARVRLPAGPRAPENSASLLIRYWPLLWRVTRTELAARYAGSFLGALWALVTPLLTLTVYALIYVVILSVRVPGFSPIQYVLYIFAGLVPFLMISEALSIGVGSVVANKAVLSNTVFPIDLVSPKAVLGSQGAMLSGLVVLLAGLALTHQLAWTVILLPVVWLLTVLGLVGIIWIISLLNVVLRDIQNVIGAVLMMLFVASPIAYTPQMVPAQIQPLIYINPMAYYILAFQHVLVLGNLPDKKQIAVLLVLSLGLFFGGGWFFPRAKRVLIDYV